MKATYPIGNTAGHHLILSMSYFQKKNVPDILCFSRGPLSSGKFPFSDVFCHPRSQSSQSAIMPGHVFSLPITLGVHILSQ